MTIQTPIAASIANTPEAFAKARATITRSGETYQLRVHRYLHAVAVHWAATGDIRPAVQRVNDLIPALPGATRTNAVKAWVEAFFGFVWGKDVKAFVAGKTKAKDLDLHTITNKRWWEFKPEPEYKATDFAKLVTKAIAEADKHLLKPHADDEIDTDQLTRVRMALKGEVAPVEISPENLFIDAMALETDQIAETIRLLQTHLDLLAEQQAEIEAELAEEAVAA